MNKYKWILSGIAVLGLIIYSCDPALEEEKVLASVDKMPDELTFGWEAEDKNITGYDKIFTFVSNADWCVVSGDKVRVEANSSNQSREASIIVNWKNETMKNIHVRQSEMGYINGLPETIAFSNGSSSRTIELTSNTSWTISSDQSWCSATPTSGNGSASVRVSATENTTSSTRTANITFKYGANTKVITVTQTGVKKLEIDIPWITLIDANAFTYDINVTSNLSWTVTSPQTWITISPKSGSGNGSVKINISENTTPTRYGRIIFTGEGITEESGLSQWGPPLNNQCSGAITLSCGANIEGETAGATLKNIPYSNVSKYGVWYTFVGDGRQTTISVSLTYSTDDSDSKIVIFRGSCSSLTYVGESGRTNRYTFRSTSGVRYYIYVGHYNPQGDQYDAEWFNISRSCQ
jgi:hypothetical protein